MNIDTGKFRYLAEDAMPLENEVEWNEDELLEVKGGLFRVVKVDVENDMVILKGINKKARKGVINKLFGE